MKITIHRGNQIGGCITEIESEKGTKIFVDLGHNLPQGDIESPDEYASDQAVKELTRCAKAIFYTHIHGDHFELFQYVPEGIEQYVGPLAYDIMTAKYKHMSYSDHLKENSMKCLKKLLSFKKYRRGQEIVIGDISITPFQVSHSAADSYMLLIRCDGKKVLHTGDFRGHGYMGDGIFKVIDKYRIAGSVDVLITEGTNVDNDEHATRPEAALKEELKEVFRHFKYNFVLCSSTDADRLESVYCANCESSKRPFVVDSLQKKLIDLIARHMEERSLFYHFGPQKIYSYYPMIQKLENLMHNQGFVMLVRKSGKFQDYLDKILPFCKPDETCLIYSQFHGYIENREGNTAFSQELYDFVEQFRRRDITVFEDIHTSGHASREDLARLCVQVNPHVIIPIHKNENADFKEILTDEMKKKVCEFNYCRDGTTILFDPPQKYYVDNWFSALNGSLSGYLLYGKDVITQEISGH